MKASKVPVSKSNVEAAGGNRMPAAKEVVFPQGSLQVKHLAIRDMTFSELRGEFKSACPLPHLPETKGLVLFFVFQGRMRLGSGDAEWNFECTEQTHNAFFWGPSGCTIEAEAGNLHALIINIAEAYFLGSDARCPGKWQDLRARASQSKPTALFHKAFYLDLQLQCCLQQILNCVLPDSCRELYMEAKVMELMALQAACGELAQLKKPRHSQSEYDQERILFAKNYLLKHMAMPPSLAKLALVSGLNEFKLKNGFREMFGNSVFAYLAETRLEIAKVALIQGRKTATEIAFELGFSSLQHFSTRFKERFGVTPTGLRHTKSLETKA